MQYSSDSIHQDLSGQRGRATSLVVIWRDFDQIKRQLLYQLTNAGHPRIDVVDGNHRNRGELYLLHHWDGQDLQLGYAQETLRGRHRLWGRPVHIETRVEGKGKLLSYDGERSGAQDLTPSGD